MSQLNINLTPEFEKDLTRYMKKKGISQKSEAIRAALHEAVESLGKKTKVNFSSWLGLAKKAPLNSNPRFKNEDQLWDS